MARATANGASTPETLPPPVGVHNFRNLRTDGNSSVPPNWPHARRNLHRSAATPGAVTPHASRVLCQSLDGMNFLARPAPATRAPAEISALAGPNRADRGRAGKAPACRHIFSATCNICNFHINLPKNDAYLAGSDTPAITRRTRGLGEERARSVPHRYRRYG